LFWDEVNRFKAVCAQESDHNRVVRIATAIYEKYIVSGSYQVNLSADVIVEVSEAFTDKSTITLNVFDKAQEEVYGLMDTDSLLRFRKSKYFVKKDDLTSSAVLDTSRLFEIDIKKEENKQQDIDELDKSVFL